MLDYVAYQMAQKRVAEVARGALPDSPVHSPAIARHPACPRAFIAPRAATGALLRGLADQLNRWRRLAASPRSTAVETAPVSPPPHRSPAPARAADPRPATAFELVDA